MEVTFFIQRTTMYWRCWRTFCSHTWHCAPGQIKISVCQIWGGAGSRHLYTFIKTKRLLLNCKCSRVFFFFFCLGLYFQLNIQVACRAELVYLILLTLFCTCIVRRGASFCLRQMYNVEAMSTPIAIINFIL